MLLSPDPPEAALLRPAEPSTGKSSWYLVVRSSGRPGLGGGGALRAAGKCAAARRCWEGCGAWPDGGLPYMLVRRAVGSGDLQATGRQGCEGGRRGQPRVSSHSLHKTHHTAKTHSMRHDSGCPRSMHQPLCAVNKTQACTQTACNQAALCALRNQLQLYMSATRTHLCLSLSGMSA